VPGARSWGRNTEILKLDRRIAALSLTTASYSAARFSILDSRISVHGSRVSIPLRELSLIRHGHHHHGGRALTTANPSFGGSVIWALRELWVISYRVLRVFAGLQRRTILWEFRSMTMEWTRGCSITMVKVIFISLRLRYSIA
jgi:hypothetical protein